MLQRANNLVLYVCIRQLHFMTLEKEELILHISHFTVSKQQCCSDRQRVYLEQQQDALCTSICVDIIIN